MSSVNVRLLLMTVVAAWMIVQVADASGLELKYALASVWLGVGIALLHRAWRS